MQLSENFTLKEFTKSVTADRLKIPNNPNAEVIENLKYLVENLMQPIRDSWKKPITISSGYRSEALNKAVGGSKNSAHVRGEAADFSTGTKEGNLALFNTIIASGLEFDQLIDEKDYSWLHVSLSKTKTNRRHILHLK